MNERVLLGQFMPRDSFVHRLDPRVKLLLTILFMVLVFYVDHFIGYGLVLVFILMVAALADLPFLKIIKGLKPILTILIFTTVLNIFTIRGEVLWKWGFFTLTKEGLIWAGFVACRIILLVLGTTILSLTTSPLKLTDGLESLLSPLKVIHFPAHELAMMVSIALRFIPTLFEETDKIIKAQKARGADFESGNILDRAKAMIPLLVPLFLNSLDRASELGVAMEARCYRGGEGRTRLNPLSMKKTDYMTLAGVSVLFVLGMVVL